MLLVAARLLVGWVRFGRWRALLGTILPAMTSAGTAMAPPETAIAPPETAMATAETAPTWLDVHMGRVVERAAERLPFHFKCLPRAMALHWMLVRRGRPGAIAFAVLPEARRGTVDDLHAWVELGGRILIGETERPYHPLARFAHGPFTHSPAAVRNINHTR